MKQIQVVSPRGTTPVTIYGIVRAGSIIKVAHLEEIADRCELTIDGRRADMETEVTFDNDQVVVTLLPSE
jgi:hypothetical protein